MQEHLHLARASLSAAIIAISGLAHHAIAGDGSDAASAASIERGATLVGVGGCMDCHTPFRMGPNGPEKDLARGLSGHPQEMALPPPPVLDAAWNWAGSASTTAFVGPWGISYASNLSPDRETGIGTWHVDTFIRAMRSGKHLGVGRPIMPPMPWQALGKLPDEDLRAMFAYLMAQPPVRNQVPDYAPPPAVAGDGKAKGSGG
jgi:mono/diheme cytochrome c family protein